MLLTIIVNSYVLSLKLLEYRADKLNMKFLGYQNVDKSFVHLLFDRNLLDLSDEFYRLRIARRRDQVQPGHVIQHAVMDHRPLSSTHKAREGAGERSKICHICLLFNP